MPSSPRLEGAVYPLLLLAALSPVLVLTAIYAEAGLENWFLEVGPALLAFVVLASSYRRLPLSRLAYTCVFLHTLVLVYGGYYTYAATPLGNWAKEAFDLSRNHYDRVGHLAFGFFPACIVKEVLLRVTPLRRGGWLVFLVLSVILGAAAFYEFIEWWSTYLVAPEVGQAFLGSQGDPWDTQWDMLLALVGAALALLVLGPLHERSMARLNAETARPSLGLEEK
jgi:putative membrane protein